MSTKSENKTTTKPKTKRRTKTSETVEQDLETTTPKKATREQIEELYHALDGMRKDWHELQEYKKAKKQARLEQEKTKYTETTLANLDIPTDDQYAAYHEIMAWYRSWYDAKDKDTVKQVYKLGGGAGTGKSWLISWIVYMIGGNNCLLITPTGKSATVLNRSGMHANTIHSQLYTITNNTFTPTIRDLGEADIHLYQDFLDTVSSIPKVYNEPPKYKLKDKTEFEQYKLIIVDESSMVGFKLQRDILSIGLPVLFVGDPNQLLPIHDEPVFLNCDYYLKEPVRFALDNPVVWLANQVLTTQKICPGMYGTSMVREGYPTEDELRYADQILTDVNTYRAILNERTRPFYIDECNLYSHFCVKDKIICRTNAPIQSSSGFVLTNGTQGIITNIRSEWEKNKVGTLYKVRMTNKDLGEFTFAGTSTPNVYPVGVRPATIEHGYAITVHLSQGSEWDNVLIFPKRMPDWRMLYTAITRARKSVLFCWSPNTIDKGYN